MINTRLLGLILIAMLVIANGEGKPFDSILFWLELNCLHGICKSLRIFASCAIPAA